MNRGFWTQRMTIKIAMPQIMVNTGIETSAAGRRSRTGSCKTIPCLFSIIWKKVGKTPRQINVPSIDTMSLRRKRGSLIACAHFSSSLVIGFIVASIFFEAAKIVIRSGKGCPSTSKLSLFDEILTFWKGFFFYCQVKTSPPTLNPEIFSVSNTTAHYSPTFARQPKRLIPFI